MIAHPKHLDPTYFWQGSNVGPGSWWRVGNGWKSTTPQASVHRIPQHPVDANKVNLGGVVQQNSPTLYRAACHAYYTLVSPLNLFIPLVPAPEACARRLLHILQNSFSKCRCRALRLVRSSIGVPSSHLLLRLLVSLCLVRKASSVIQAADPGFFIDVVIRPSRSSCRSCQCYLHDDEPAARVRYPLTVPCDSPAAVASAISSKFRIALGVQVISRPKPKEINKKIDSV